MYDVVEARYCVDPVARETDELFVATRKLFQVEGAMYI